MIRSKNGLRSHTPPYTGLKPDKRSRTSAANGKLGGRPKTLQDWDGGLPSETWKPLSGELIEFESSLGRKIRINRGAIKLVKK